MERTYNVPLRKETQRAVRHKRTNRAVRALRTFISRHMKSEVVKIGKELNFFLWKHGARNPPHHVKVIATKDADGKVSVNLESVKDAPAKEAKKAEKKTSKKVAPKKEEKAEEKKEVAKEKVEKKEATPKEKAPAKEKEEVKASA